MPHQDSNLTAPEGTTTEKPQGTALGFVNEHMTISVLPTGAVLAIIDPKFAEADGYVMMALKHIDKNRLELVCPCGDKQCSRRVTARFHWTGHHPKQTRMNNG